MFGAIYGDIIGSYYETHCTKDYDFEYIHHFLKQPLSDNLCSFHKADANIASAFLLPHLTHTVLSVISPIAPYNELNCHHFLIYVNVPIQTLLFS